MHARTSSVWAVLFGITLNPFPAALLAQCPPSQCLTHGAACSVGPGAPQTWTPFAPCGLVSQYWNPIGISSSIDYDIRVNAAVPCGTTSGRTFGDCDFVIADLNAGTQAPCSTLLEWRRWASGTATAALQHATLSWLDGGVGCSYAGSPCSCWTWAPTSQAGSVIRSLDFRPQLAGTYGINLNAVFGVRWYLFKRTGTTSWRNRDGANAEGGTGSGQFTILSTELNVWHAIVLAKDGGSSIGSPVVTITPPPLGAPSLLAPTNGGTNVPTTATLDWTDVAGAAGYSVEVCLDPAMSNCPQRFNVPASQTTVSLNTCTTYWWRINAVDACGQVGGWSPIWSFATNCGLPDLEPTILSGPSGFVGGGQSFQVSYTIRNNTPAPVSSFSVKIYVSPDTNISTSDCELYTIPNLSIGGNSTISASVTITMPTVCALPPVPCSLGPKYWGIIADPANSIPETVENNNALSGGSCIVYNRGSFLVTGSASYDDHVFNSCQFTGWQVRPIGLAQIEAWEVDGSQLTLITTGQTDASGNFAVTIPNNIDPGGGPRDVRVYVVARLMPGGQIEVRPPTGTAYGTSVTTTDWRGCDLALGNINPGGQGDGHDAVFNLFDVLKSGFDYVSSLPGTPAPCLVFARWGIGYDPPACPGSSCFPGGQCPPGFGQEIVIKGIATNPDEFDDSVILHEYGHAMASQYSWSRSRGVAHGWTSNYENYYRTLGLTCLEAQQLVWNEGWASYFGSAVRGQDFYLDTVGDGSNCNLNSSVNLELPSFSTAAVGADCELAVAAALWDIFDGGSFESFDRLAAGFTPSWSVVRNPQYFSSGTDCTLRDFWRGWFGLNLGSRDEMYDIFDDRRIQYIPKLSVDRYTLNFGTINSRTCLPVSVDLKDTGLPAQAIWSSQPQVSWISSTPPSGSGASVTSLCPTTGPTVQTSGKSVCADPSGLPQGPQSGELLISATSNQPGGVAYSPRRVNCMMTVSPPLCTMAIDPPGPWFVIVAGGPASAPAFNLIPCNQAGAGTWSFTPDPGWPGGLSYSLAPTGQCTCQLTLVAAANVPPAPNYSGRLDWTGTCNGQSGTRLENRILVEVRPFVTIACPQPLPNGSAGSLYVFDFLASGGIPPYQWSGTGLPSWLTLNPSTGRISGTPGFTGNWSFSVGVYDSVGANATCNANLQVDCLTTRPNATVCCDAQICRGASATLNVSIAGNGPWYVRWSDGLEENVASSPYSRVVWPTSTTTYSIKFVRDSLGCTGSGIASARVTVNALPTGTVSGSASICAGGCTPIQAALTGTPPWDVRWSDGYEQNGVETSPATRSVCPISTTTYSVSNVTDGNRCSNTGTDSAVITVDVAPSIQSHPRSVAVCGGGRAVFCVIASGSLPLSYQWRKYGNPIPGATADCLTIDPVTFGDRGDYDVIVINHCGREISRFANLAVSLLFASPVPYVAGVSPVALTLADFSVPPDGAPDVAAANRDSNDLTVRWNDGQGRFGAAPTTVTLFSGDQPSALAAGDFVPGGGRDIVVACPGANVVKVISNTGVFSFVAPLPLPAGTSQPSALAVGDFDGQSTDDVAVALAGTGTAAAGVAVILNSGQATLLADGSFSGPRQDVVAADLDGDGDLDLAVTVSAASSPRVLLYQNIGPRSGNFILAGALTAPGTPYALCARDLDGNGRMDLAVTVESSSLPEQGGVILFLHDSKPGMSPDNFSATSIFTGPSLPGRIAAADLARNSIPGFVSLEDLVTANRASGDISEWFGFYGPAFQAVVHCPAGAEPVAVGLADLNRDARPDIVVANRVSQDVSVFLHNPLALAQVFGAGCPGTGGRTPQVSTVGVPNLGNTAFALQVDDARPNSSAYLLISGGLSPFNIGGGCWIYPDLGGTLMGLFTNETGSAVLPVPLPPSPSPLNGLDLYVQWAIVDPEGAYGNVLAFSAGLRIMLGQPF